MGSQIHLAEMDRDSLNVLKHKVIYYICSLCVGTNNHFASSFFAGGEVTKPRFAQYFHGSLASLTIRPGKIESQKVISCLQACKEGLDINSLESLGQGIKVRDELTSSLIKI